MSRDNKSNQNLANIAWENFARTGNIGFYTLYKRITEKE